MSGTGSGMQQIYIHTEEAEQVTQNADFLALYDHFMELVEIAEDEGCDVAEDLPKEDDEGDTEYKYKLCGLTLDKLEKRTTQMAFRLCVSNNYLKYTLLTKGKNAFAFWRVSFSQNYNNSKKNGGGIF